MKTEDLLQRVDHLLQQGNTVLASKHNTSSFTDIVKFDLQGGFRAAGLSFLKGLYGEDHPYFAEFDRSTDTKYGSGTSRGISVLQSVRHEIQNGWLSQLSSLVAADIFSSFIEMAEHLLGEGYKDAAAVIIGSVLEEHLRQLCQSHNIDTHIMKDGNPVPKKAATLNEDLKKESVYGPIEQKQVIAWLGLRNSAAHGKYSEYTKEQVLLMYQGVLNFISQTKSF